MIHEKFVSHQSQRTNDWAENSQLNITQLIFLDLEAVPQTLQQRERRNTANKKNFSALEMEVVVL